MHKQSWEAVMSESIRRSITKMLAHRTRTIMGALIAIAALTLLLVSISISLPDNEIRVTSFEPNGWTSSATNMTIKFSKPMVPKDSLDRPVLTPPLVFTPPIRGLARWVETDVLRFFPDGELAPATEYTAKVTSDKSWGSGLKIAEKQVYKFWTSYLNVTGTYSTVEQSTDNADRVRLSVIVNFNYPVNLNELKNRISLKGDKNTVKGELQFTLTPQDNNGTSLPIDSIGGQSQAVYAPRFQLVTEQIEQTSARQMYRLVIDKGVTCQSCGLALVDQYSTSIEVGQKNPLTVNQVDARSAGDGGVIYVYLSERVLADAVRPYITLSPATEYTIETEWSTVLIRGKFRPGDAFDVKVAKGMPGIGATPLANDFSTRVKFPDLEPSVTFSSRAIFLPKSGNGLMEVKTTNIPMAAVEIEQVFPNNLVHFLNSGYGDDSYGYYMKGQLSRSLIIRDLPLEGRLNEPILTSIDLASLVGDTAHGIFKISVRSKNERWIADTRYAMITDIGISARLSDDYLMVWANSLTGTSPISGAVVSLISKNNQTLVYGKTDSRGVAIFDKIKDKLNGFEPFVITVTSGSDLAYLRLDETLLPIADFDVSGRPYLTSGYEAFIYSDRGVYRPGDTAHLVSIVRGTEGSVPQSFPYFLTVYDSRGKKFTSFKLTTENGALSAQDFVVPDYAGTGKYSVTAEIGENLQIGQAAFQVEDFMPDRIKVSSWSDNQRRD
jgi:hypothetical protein